MCLITENTDPITNAYLSSAENTMTNIKNPDYISHDAYGSSSFHM